MTAQMDEGLEMATETRSWPQERIIVLFIPLGTLPAIVIQSMSFAPEIAHKIWVKEQGVYTNQGAQVQLSKPTCTLLLAQDAMIYCVLTLLLAVVVITGMVSAADPTFTGPARGGLGCC